MVIETKNTKRNIAFGIFVIITSSLVYSLMESIDISPRFLQVNKTNSTRTQTVSNLCSGKSRNGLISSSAQSDNINYRANINSQFKLNSTQIVKQALDGNTSYVTSQLQSKALMSYVFFVGPFLLGFILLLLLFPFIGCCCCCPSCCPSKCCQKDDNEPYTKCQLYWPSIVLILALLLACASSIAGLTKATSFTTGFNNIMCSSSIMLDDFMNGNTTVDGSSFFLGLTTLSTKIGELSTNINSISNNLAMMNSSNIGYFTTQLNNALTDISKIPTNVPNVSLTLTYNTPFTGTTSSTTTSLFPSVLGTPANSTTLVGASYAVVLAIKNTINTISTNVDTFSSSISSFSSSFSSVQTTIDNFVSQLRSADNSVNSFYDSTKNPLGYINIGMMVFFAVTIGLSVLGIFGLLLMVCCQKLSCRYLIYFSCCVLLFIAFIGFFISVIFSIFVPPIFFFCEALDYSFLSASNFDYVFGKKLGNDSKYITTCLLTQSGLIVEKIAPSINSTLSSLSTSVNTLNTFNTTALNASVNSAFNLIGTAIDDYQSNKINDLSSSNQLSQLIKLSVSSNYGCTHTNFALDSWIPSTSQTVSYVPCSISGGTSVTSCASFNSNGCNGCLDTYALLVNNGAVNSLATAKSFVWNRYGSQANCQQYATELSSTWDRFYNVKKTSLASVKSNFNTAQASVNTAVNSLTSSVNGNVTSIMNTLNTTTASITSPTDGLVAGLNCKLIGEDLQRVIQVTCLELFNNMYFLRLVLGIASFGILFTMCCAVCTGVRHYKHGERKDKKAAQEQNMNYEITHHGLKQ